MIPAAFDYQRATSLDDALAAIAGGDAKVLAGGMSLLPLMKLRLAQPGKLVDIGGLDELKALGPTADGGYEVGALATYAEVLAAAPHRHSPATASAASATSRSAIAARSAGRSATPIRPATLPALALALDYSLVLRSARGERTVPVDGFFTGAFPTAIEPDELIDQGRPRAAARPAPAARTGSWSTRRRATRIVGRRGGRRRVRRAASPTRGSP